MAKFDFSDQRCFKIGDSVQFKDEYLNKWPDEKKRYSERIGKVTGFRMGACDPNVEFAKDGRRKEQKLIGAKSMYLENVTTMLPPTNKDE
jgi:hypothetical protein